MKNSTQRLIYVFLLALTIALGLFSRSHLVSASGFFGKYAGDTLWALAVYWAIAIAFPASRTSRVLTAALLFSLAIELSQLYHAEWIDHIRSYRLAALMLGHSFLWSDLVCYFVGACAGGLIDFRFIRSPRFN
ncbi:MAG: DUF2809 domain-containing protein [Akkermansiaceae bacterium]